jgi:threonylcarbamoyladenosine tRNA methylthiotransferase MtaB
MPQLRAVVVKDRAARLRAKGAAMEQARLSSLVGAERQVLVERNGTGHTPCYAPVKLEGLPGTLVKARLSGLDAGYLLGGAA